MSMFQEEREELLFDWKMIGDVGEDRPNPEAEMKVAVCRLMQFTLRDVPMEYTGKDFQVREVDCWCTGERICRFEITLKRD